MVSQTSWVKKTYKSKGLDPLAVQAISINIYSQLLPGITNVTERARYYSFYPWMVWVYEHLSETKTLSDFVEWVRRADCLFTMIGIRHLEASGDDNFAGHERGLVGSSTLHQAVVGLGQAETLHLSDFTVLDDDKPLRYFKNRLGGLKQYYIGTLDGLGLMTTVGSSVANTNEGGIPLAEAMDAAVDRERFTETVLADEVSVDTLDALRSFCPCQLAGSPLEHTALVDLFFERNRTTTEEGHQRRSTLTLILDLVKAMAAGGNGHQSRFDQSVYRGCVYAGFLPGDQEWKLSPALRATQRQWKTYQKHELLSIAVQSIFWLALDFLAEERPKLYTTEDFIRWFGEQMQVVAAANELDGNYSEALAQTREKLPALSDWLHEEHEITLARKTLDVYRDHKKRAVRGELVRSAGKLLLTIVARDDGSTPAYDPLTFPAEYFALYPINLESLRRLTRDTWPSLSVPHWLAWVAGHWGIEAHLRVALRKLRYQTKDTFHLRPSDHGLEVDAMPDPTYTNPRFSQAVQILEDLGAITHLADGQGLALTPLGEELWENYHA